MRAFRKSIVFILVLTFVMSLVPFGMSMSVMAAQAGEEPVTVHIPFVNVTGHRSDKGSDTGALSKGSSYYYFRASDKWRGSGQVDFSMYEEILRNEGTTVAFKFYTGNGGYGSGGCYDFEIFALKDALDSMVFKDLTYNEANNLGVWDKTRPVLYARSDATDYGSRKILTCDIDKNVLINTLDESLLNGMLSFGVTGYKTSTNQSSLTVTHPDSGVYITYYPSEIDKEAHLNEYKSEMTWDNLTSDSAADFKNSLPNYFRGANIEWSANSNELNILSDGTFKRPRGGDVSATLTANVSMGEYAYSKNFEVTAPILLPIVKKVSATSANVKQIGVKYGDTAYPTEYSAFYMNSSVMYDVPSSGRGDTHVFAKIDLSDSLKELEAATKVTFNLVNRNSSKTTNAMVAVLSNRYDKWDGTITYNSAINSGMYTDPGYCIEYGCTVNNSSNLVPAPIDTANMMKAIKDAVAANPDEGLVTFRISSRDWNQIAFQLSGGAGWPFVEITYYEEDLMTDDELKAAKKDKVQWTALTSQDIDNVVSDLDLPATWYGAPVTWESSDESVITSSGEVIIGNESKNVTLTATVDKAVNTFNVTVPANKVATKSEITHRVGYASGGANLNYSAAIIYANEDIAGTPDVIIATYNADGMLDEITVKENVTIKKGLTCVPSGYHYVTSKSATTKAFVVDDIETLNPLGIAR